jgi:hypothetical protein
LKGARDGHLLVQAACPTRLTRQPVPTFALVTPGGSILGAHDLDDDEASGDAVIRREGQPDFRVVGELDLEQLGSDVPGPLPVLILKRV